jgi:hypothetical protein
MVKRVGAALAFLLGGLCVVALAGDVSNNNRNASIYVQATEPVAVDVGYLWFDTSLLTMKVATAINPTAWSDLGAGGGGGGSSVPTGSILLVDSGTCPAGYAEVAGLDGKTPIGTLVANGDLGTTGGSDSLTPAGAIGAQTFTGTLASLTHSGANVTSTFTGAALGTHAHELPFQIPSTTTTRQLASATFGTGTSRAATAVSGTGTSNTTSAAVALSQAVSAGTPAGTVANTITQPSAHSYTPQGTVSAGSFTGSSADNRSAFVKVLYCKKS